MTTGRPTSYDPSFCDAVIEAGKQGKSVTWIADHLGVVKQTLFNWMAVHPEFLDAMTRAKQAAQVWWEDTGQNNMLTQGFNASVWSRSMAARFPDDWREVKGTELSAPGGGAVQLETKTTVDVTGLSDEQLAALASIHTG